MSVFKNRSMRVILAFATLVVGLGAGIPLGRVLSHPDAMSKVDWSATCNGIGGSDFKELLPHGSHVVTSWTTLDGGTPHTKDALLSPDYIKRCTVDAEGSGVLVGIENIRYATASAAEKDFALNNDRSVKDASPLKAGPAVREQPVIGPRVPAQHLTLKHEHRRSVTAAGPVRRRTGPAGIDQRPSRSWPGGGP